VTGGLLLALTCAAPARAYDIGIGIVGNEGHYAIVTGNFTSTERAEIDAGAAAWNAGAGEVLRGADWEWIRDADVSSGGRNNFRNEVYERDQAFFDANHWSDALAVTTPLVLNDRDIIFNSDETWVECLPSDCQVTTESSIGHVAMHEFGHRIGFNHENDFVATMNSEYENGGDIGDTAHRINEDDFAGLAYYYPGSSTGINLMLSKWAAAEEDGFVSEQWETPGHIFDLSANSWVGPSGPPGDVLVLVTGTSTASPLIEWRLSSNSTCTSVDPLVGSRTPTVGVNVPYSVGPSAWNVSGVSAANYYLCVLVDADNSVTETSGVDNGVRSDYASLTVIP